MLTISHDITKRNLGTKDLITKFNRLMQARNNHKGSKKVEWNRLENLGRRDNPQKQMSTLVIGGHIVRRMDNRWTTTKNDVVFPRGTKRNRVPPNIRWGHDIRKQTFTLSRLAKKQQLWTQLEIEFVKDAIPYLEMVELYTCVLEMYCYIYKTAIVNSIHSHIDIHIINYIYDKMFQYLMKLRFYSHLFSKIRLNFKFREILKSFNEFHKIRNSIC